MKKTITRIAGVVIAFVVGLAAMMVSGNASQYAFAAETTTITVKGTGSQYSAYRLLNVSIGTAADGSNTYAYTVNSKYEDVLKTATGKTSDADIISYLNGLSSDSTQLEAFSQAVNSAIAKAGLAADATATGDGTSATFSGVDQGYYLIAQSDSTSSTAKSKSLMILQTAGKTALTVNAKEGTPTVVKKVKENTDGVNDSQAGKYQDAADYNIGDDVPFQLTGTLPATLASYKTYKYVFHDTQSAGLTFNPGSVKVYAVAADGTRTEVNSSAYTLVTSGLSDGETFQVKFDDVKTLTSAAGAAISVDSATKIVVEYTAKLNDNAKLGKPGNPNEVYLEFSNNPNAGGEGETGHTPKDKVIVFTFQAVAKKVDEKGNALKGAGFTLYRQVNGDWVKVATIEAGETTTFTFKGLDSGKYKLSETTVPNGYTKASDIEFTLSATYETTSDDPKLTALTVDPSDAFTVDSTLSTATTTVINKSGFELPKTGGAGLVLLYVVGIGLIAGAVIALVARRRHESASDK